LSLVPCYKTPKNAIKKSSETTEGRGKKNGGKNANFCVMSPNGFFGKKYRAFELPLLRNAQKNKNKNT
jgi:hypothetical protein